MKDIQKYNGIDVFKLIMSIFVVAIHTNPLYNCTNELVVKIYSSLTACAVPFFFIASGYMIQIKTDNSSPEGICIAIKKHIKKLVKLYLIWTAIYVPLSIYDYITNRYSLSFSLLHYVRGLLLIGEHYNSWPLWYLLSSIYALILIFFLFKHGTELRNILIIGFLIFMFGSLISLVGNYVGEYAIFNIFSKMIRYSIMNGRIFTGMFYIPLGMHLAHNKISLKYNFLLFIEGYLLSVIGIKGDIPLIMCSIGLFGVAAECQLPKSNLYYFARKMSTSIYFVHMWVWTIYYYLVYGEKTFGLDSFLVTTFISILISIIYILFIKKYKIFRLNKITYS